MEKELMEERETTQEVISCDTPQARPRKANKVIIVKTTKGCDLECVYCYENAQSFPPSDRETRGSPMQMTMNRATMENMIEKISRYNTIDSYTEFLWHGGEPTLLGRRFYEDVLRVQERLRRDGYTIDNAIMTNGVGLTDEDIDFFVEHKFKLGISIDGTRLFHDQSRRDRHGQGTFDRAYATLKKIQQKGQRIGALMVLTRMNYENVSEAYDFFRSEGIDFKIISLFRGGRASQQWADLSITPEMYGTAMNELFDMWMADTAAPIFVDPPATMLRNLIHGRITDCTFQPDCQETFFSVEPNGDIYPCGRFDGFEAFRYGNINTDSMDTILGHRSRQNLLHRWEQMVGCTACDYSSLCHGGCMENAFMNGDVQGRDSLCTAYKMMYDHIAAYLRTLPAAPEDAQPESQQISILGRNILVSQIANPNVVHAVMMRTDEDGLNMLDYGDCLSRYREYSRYDRWSTRYPVYKEDM